MSWNTFDPLGIYLAAMEPYEQNLNYVPSSPLKHTRHDVQRIFYRSFTSFYHAKYFNLSVNQQRGDRV